MFSAKVSGDEEPAQRPHDTPKAKLKMALRRDFPFTKYFHSSTSTIENSTI
jgi:hypothetical protein